MNNSNVSRIFLVLFTVALLVSPAAAQTLQLVAKQPGSWAEMPEHGTAEITYSSATGTFQLTAHHLIANEQYVLVQHTENRNGQGYIITRMTTSDQGTASVEGKWPYWQGKIWLVLARDVAGTAGDRTVDRLIGWHPRHYLFETRLL
nr:hypothetical protein [uncultured Desulfuromonas sp.]